MNLRNWKFHDWVLAVAIVVVFTSVGVLAVMALQNVTRSIYL